MSLFVGLCVCFYLSIFSFKISLSGCQYVCFYLPLFSYKFSLSACLCVCFYRPMFSNKFSLSVCLSVCFYLPLFSYKFSWSICLYICFSSQCFHIKLVCLFVYISIFIFSMFPNNQAVMIILVDCMIENIFCSYLICSTLSFFSRKNKQDN